jgi:IS30 family transposase
MPPTHLAPSAPVPAGRYLSFGEREEIAIELAKGTAIRAIARKLARSPSTVSREVRRNAATRGGSLDYRAIAAQWHADRAARRPRPDRERGRIAPSRGMSVVG